MYALACRWLESSVPTHVFHRFFFLSSLLVGVLSCVLGQTCHSVIGCRLSPDQKRALVALVRENVPGTRTLSIGKPSTMDAVVVGAVLGFRTEHEHAALMYVCFESEVHA